MIQVAKDTRFGNTKALLLFETPQDALEWQKTQPDSYYIPLYDFQGNEIGSFLRERNNLTIAEMEAMKG